MTIQTIMIVKTFLGYFSVSFPESSMFAFIVIELISKLKFYKYIYIYMYNTLYITFSYTLSSDGRILFNLKLSLSTTQWEKWNLTKKSYWCMKKATISSFSFIILIGISFIWEALFWFNFRRSLNVWSKVYIKTELDRLVLIKPLIEFKLRWFLCFDIAAT